LRAIRVRAQDLLGEKGHEKASIELEIEDAIETQLAICELVAEIKRNDHFPGDPFEQAYHHKIAADGSSILELIDEEIVLIVDENDELTSTYLRVECEDQFDII
jgi:hypothetical protein